MTKTLYCSSGDFLVAGTHRINAATSYNSPEGILDCATQQPGLPSPGQEFTQVRTISVVGEARSCVPIDKTKSGSMLAQLQVHPIMERSDRGSNSHLTVEVTGTTHAPVAPCE
ncbi:MAG: hypothetical protein QF363_14220 [Planctomycetaceae bacterium]|jgi:hypothetical protein|nr:hypothetical protein [Planctomycetaceae bacterium]